MHPVQAAPRQRYPAGRWAMLMLMHPVQAAPRQRPGICSFSHGFAGCTPCRQRRGKAALLRGYTPRVLMHPVQAAPRQSSLVNTNYLPWWMHPVQAAPRQRSRVMVLLPPPFDAPRAGSAEAKLGGGHGQLGSAGCTPCRQRRGKVAIGHGRRGCGGMHPVQAAPRQRPVGKEDRLSRRDAPRAGSAEAKTSSSSATQPVSPMHPVQAAPRQRVASPSLRSK